MPLSAEVGDIHDSTYYYDIIIGTRATLADGLLLFAVQGRLWMYPEYNTTIQFYPAFV